MSHDRECLYSHGTVCAALVMKLHEWTILSVIVLYINCKSLSILLLLMMINYIYIEQLRNIIAHTLLDKPNKISKVQIFSHASSCCFQRSKVCGYVHMQNACISSYIRKRDLYFFGLYEISQRQFDISNKIKSLLCCVLRRILITTCYI